MSPKHDSHGACRQRVIVDQLGDMRVSSSIPSPALEQIC